MVIGASMTISPDDDSTTGISAAEFNLGGDKIRVAPRKGGDTMDYPLPKPTKQEGGKLVFEINL